MVKIAIIETATAIHTVLYLAKKPELKVCRYKIEKTIPTQPINAITIICNICFNKLKDLFLSIILLY